MTNVAEDSVVMRLDADTQRCLVDQVRAVCKASPLVRPQTTNGLAMRVRVTAAGALGWVGDGIYHYSPTDKRGNPWPPIPALWTEIADKVAGAHPWDCAIVNWYDEDAALSWHRDQSERDKTKPIVTISLGDAASWAMREDDRTKVHRTRIESGDVTLLAGPTRMWLHAVERIIPSPLLSPLGTRRGRISITLRVAG